MSKEDIIAEIGKHGKAVPEHLTEKKKLMDYLENIEAGATDAELADLFPVPEMTYSAAEVKAMVEKARLEGRQTGFSEEQVQAMIDKALAGRPVEREAVQVRQMKEKPDVFDSRKTSPEDFMEKGFRIFHANHSHSFTKFMIDGRLVEPPFSKMIFFDPYLGPETQQFGLAKDIAVMCVHTTHSRTVKAYFEKDFRMGGEFWTTETEPLSEDLERSILYSQISKRMDDVGQADLQRMCFEREIPKGTIEMMRAKIALDETNRTMAQRKLDKAGSQALLEKEKLLATV
jgi:hypothetical protein